MKCSLCSRWSSIPSGCNKRSNAILFHKDSSALVKPYLRLRCISADLSQIFMWGQLSGACTLFWHCTHLYFLLLRASSRSKAAIPLFESGKPVGCTFALGRCNKEAEFAWNRLQGEAWARQALLSTGPGHPSLSRAKGMKHWTVRAHLLTDSWRRPNATSGQIICHQGGTWMREILYHSLHAAPCSELLTSSQGKKEMSAVL